MIIRLLFGYKSHVESNWNYCRLVSQLECTCSLAFANLVLRCNDNFKFDFPEEVNFKNGIKTALALFYVEIQKVYVKVHYSRLKTEGNCILF